ncbi:zinc ribbon domain-containing protein [Liquorilactobacillus satsumensis]|nr:zinc ribbon domain-containing protein [Liquorilactobacillus satsumensis]MCP9328816.1 zinc ribbon domain-containing protein [Liquorilactobacillus satsumensis]MCP9356834.1 zinc ribbon domain-containing protein [Liquorilactobacillus satsumensis]MCP9360193.1 zinc ribbon domain-containing protein [Liquorilactobacillus satsumensis]MCP9370774.1 zinc ribbon domain-containing protein [Liquorilactobacillus satsumensis]
MKLAYDIVTCQSCGKKVASGKYCSSCGARFISSSEKEDVEVSVCVNCGALTPSKEYCSACGFHDKRKYYF